jgi:hypothetical protein
VVAVARDNGDNGRFFKICGESDAIGLAEKKTRQP